MDCELLRCERCGTAITAGPLIPGLDDTGSYDPQAPRLSRLVAPILRSFDHRRLRILGKAVKPPARVLDIGAGRGRFVATAIQAGFDATGLESAAGRVASAQRNGIALQHSSLAEAEFGAGSFDAICLWHTLEHLADPSLALDRVWSWLRPGGVLLVGVPNLRSLQAWIGRGRWYAMDVPRHRTHFTPHGVRAVLLQHGFQPLATHYLLAEHNVFGMWQTLANRVTPTPSYLFFFLKRSVPLRPVDLLITCAMLSLVPFSSILELIASLARHGGSIAVLAQRSTTGVSQSITN